MSTLLLQDDFSDQANSSLLQALLAHPLIEFAPGQGPDGKNAVRVSYVGFDMGSQRIVVDYPIGRLLTKARLTYSVFFEDDFQWTQGGKLPGLGPLHHLAGGRDRRKNGWSARSMFLTDGHCRNYLYDQSDALWGEGAVTTEPVFQKNVWHQVDLEVGLNTAGASDGFIKMFLDGSLILEDKGVMYAGEDSSEAKIQMLLFHTFHGGQTPDWAPQDENGNYVRVHARFADFEVMDLD